MFLYIRQNDNIGWPRILQRALLGAFRCNKEGFNLWIWIDGRAGWTEDIEIYLWDGSEQAIKKGVLGHEFTHNNLFCII